jgi:hypothetical protein
MADAYGYQQYESPGTNGPQTPPNRELSNTEKFDSALAGMVNKERGDVYGHPSINFARIQALKEVVEGCEDFELREALEAICVKIGRLIQTPSHFDSWLDIAGYARCAVMILDKRNEK